MSVGVRVDRLRLAIREAVGREASVEVTPWVTRVTIPRPPSDDPGWPALMTALRTVAREGGRWGHLESASDGSVVYAELTEDDGDG